MCVCVICNGGVALEGHYKPFVLQLLASFITASMMMKEVVDPDDVTTTS